MKHQQLTIFFLFFMLTQVVQAQLSNSAFQPSTLSVNKQYQHQGFGFSLRSKKASQNRFSQKNISRSLNWNSSSYRTPTKPQSIFKVNNERPSPTIGFHLSPVYRRSTSLTGSDWIDKGFVLGVNYEFFLSRRLSILGGLTYERRWQGYESDTRTDYKTQGLGAAVLARMRFTNPDKKLVFFGEFGLRLQHEFIKANAPNNNWQTNGLTGYVQLGIGAEYKLSDKVSLTATIRPNYAGASGFRVEGNIGLRIKLGK